MLRASIFVLHRVPALTPDLTALPSKWMTYWIKLYARGIVFGLAHVVLLVASFVLCIEVMERPVRLGLENPIQHPLPSLLSFVAAIPNGCLIFSFWYSAATSAGRRLSPNQPDREAAL